MNQGQIVFSLLVLTAAIPAFSQSKSSSASYTLDHAPPGTGGGPVTNGSNVTAEISVGDALAGPVSNLTTNGVQEKPNYIGQLYDVTSLSLTAAPETVDEGATRQVAATATMDDETLLVIDPTEVTWSVSSGPLAAIDPVGLATAGVVYEDTPAIAQGTYQAFTDLLGLTVLDSDPDNYLGYAGDGIDDGWQVGFYGEPPNAEAAPGFDKDGDGQDNESEWLTGFDPLDPTSFFQFRILGKVGPSSTLEINKVIPDRTYTVHAGTDLQTLTEEVATLNPTSVETDKQVDDPGASLGRKFYRVEVTKP